MAEGVQSSTGVGAPATDISAAAAAGTLGVVARPASVSTWRLVGLCLLLAELVVLYAPTAVFLWERWTRSVWHNAHGAFVPPIVAYLIYQELKNFKGSPARGSAWGFVLLVPALLLHAIDAGMHTQLLAAASILVALPGLSLLLIGVDRTRAIAFPLVFLAAALPIPLGMTEQIHLQLRVIATAGTAWVMPLLGIPVFVEGTTLHVAAGPIEVSDACSGFSTLYAAGAVALLTAYSSPAWHRRALVLLCAAPLAIAANILRIVSLVLLVIYQGSDVLETFIHPLSGMLTFALALPIIFWLGGSSRPSAPATGAAA